MPGMEAAVERVLRRCLQKDPNRRWHHITDVRIEPGTDGPIYRSIVIRGTATSGTEPDGVLIEIRLAKETKQVQVAVTIRKLRVTDPEGIYVAFQFALPDGPEDGEVSYEAQGGLVVPGVTQLTGYSSDWHEKAVTERGLKNIPTTADALPAFREASVVKLFESTGVLSPVELESRFEVYAEQYVLSIEVEAKLVIDMAKTLIYPAAIDYLSTLASTGASLSAMGVELDNTAAKTVAEHANAMMTAVAKLSEALGQEGFGSTEEHMQFCANVIRSLMEEVRRSADALEAEVADELWPLPKYQEMLFIK